MLHKERRYSIFGDSLQFGRKIKVFIDLKAAYDKTDIKHILNLLIKRNVPTKLINLIKNLFTNCYSNVLFNDTISNQFYRETGIFQGYLLAPLLFNIFIDTLAEDLQKETDKIYAQDNSNTNLSECTKTNTEFQRLKLNGNYFANSAHRSNILKSHVLSHLEYAIQLISLRTQTQNSKIKPQKEKIQKLILSDHTSTNS